MRGLRPITLVSVVAAGLVATALSRVWIGPRRDNLLLELLLVLAVGAAAWSFQRDDPPRRPWLLLTVSVGLLFAAHVATPWTRNTGVVSVRHVLTFSHNVTWALAMYQFGRVVRDSGVRRRWKGRARLVIVGLAVAAGAIAVHALMRTFAPVVAKGASATAYDLSLALVNGSSAVANAFVLVVAVDLARALLPMRGGALAQPYVLLASGAAGLLVIDLVTTTFGLATYVVLGPAFHYLMALSWTSVAAAGIAQTMLVRSAALPLSREAQNQE